MKLVYGALTAAVLGLAVQPAKANFYHLNGLQDALAKANDKGDEKKPALDRKQAAKKVVEKQTEIKDLSDKAVIVQTKMSSLLAAGDPTKSKDALDALRQMVDELAAINKRLGELASDIEEIKGWIEGQNESLPIMEQDILQLKNFKGTNYIQMQYRDANNVDGTGNFAGQHSFQLRRIRFGFGYQIDSKASMKVSFDGGAGTDQRGFELKDAILNYDIAPSTHIQGTTLSAGQMPIILGYELQRSSSEREFPERLTFNRRMMNGERSRGAMITHGLNENSLVYAGLFTPLTVSDAEQSGKAPVGKVGGLLGAKYYNKNMEFGAAYFLGKRPMVGTDPTKSNEADRRFFYVDAVYNGLLIPELSLRAEYMTGHDRVPSATAKLDDGNNMNGYQLQLMYTINKRNQIFTRWGVSDFNTATDGNAVREYGLGYRYYMNGGAFVTLTWEQFDDPALLKNRYNVTTLRYTFKF